MGTYWVAPGITIQQYKEEMRYEVFYNRSKQWIMANAVEVSKTETGGIPALIIATSIFEPIGSILLNNVGDKGAKFSACFEYMFPKSTAISNLMYNSLRGGLFHEGFITVGLVLKDLTEPVEYKGDTIYVDPKRYVQAVDEGLDRFYASLSKDENGLKPKFDAYWNKQAQTNERLVLGGRTPTIDLPPLATGTGGYYSGAMPVTLTDKKYTSS
jgi:hypothetical protein